MVRAGARGAWLTRADDLSPEDADALEQALLTVIDTIGEPEACGISERRMKEVLWDTYFDAQAAVDQLLQEKEREDAQARKQAGEYSRDGGRDGATASADAVRAPGAASGRPQARTTGEPGPPAGAPHAPANQATDTHATRADAGHSREPAAAPPVAPPAQAAPAPSPAPRKPLSKLQQKMQANRLKKAGAAPGGASPAPSGSATPPAPAEQAPPPPVSTAPSGARIADLFPAPNDVAELRSRRSVVADAPGSGSGALRFSNWRDDGTPAPPREDRTALDAQMERLREVFSKLSPDDVVLRARAGTRLAH